MRYEIDGKAPAVADDVFVAPTAALIGDVHVAEGASVWFGAVLRGDVERIEIGATTNVQDGCVLHADPGIPVRVGGRVTVGHGAIVHGAVVEDEAMIGMGATLMNGCRVGERAIVAAGALVTEGMEVPAGTLVTGVPATVRRELTDAEVSRRARGAGHYRELAARYREQLP